MCRGAATRLVVVLLVSAVATVSCGAVNGSREATATANLQASGRFSVLQGTAHLSSGKDVPVILRVDSATGETWRLADEPQRWVGVEDELQRAGTYNLATKKVEWGVKAPDGRDLNQLSKEELVRYLAAAIRNGQNPNPKDPLGLFDQKK